MSLLLLVPQASATETGAATAPTLRGQIQEKRAVIRENVKDAHEEIKNIRVTTAAENKQVRTELATERCARITAEIDRRVQKFTTSHTHRATQFEMIKTRVQEQITQLESKGIDTAKVKADLVIFDTKLRKLIADRDAYLAALHATKSPVCGQSQGEFAKALAAARAAQKLVLTDTQDLLDFVKNTLKPDLQALRPSISPKPTRVIR